MEKIATFRTSQGSVYLIKFSKFDSDAIETKVPIIDLVLKQDVNKGHDNYELLNYLSKEVLSYLDKHRCVIYFYCDHEFIHKNERNSKYSNQEYRSKIFNSMFQRMKQKSQISNQAFDYVIRNIEIVDPENGDHFISVISKILDIDDLELIQKELLSLENK